MKKLLAIILAAVMIAACSVTAFAETTNVSYNVDPSYTVSIPAAVTLGDSAVEADITASDVILEGGKQVVVELTSASNTASGSTFNAKNGDSAVTYTITGDEAIAVGDTVAIFTANGSKTLTFSAADKTAATVAGTHTETLTFGISVESASTPVTAITLNKTETLLGVGSTETLSVSSVTPDNATDQTVTWSSDNTSVATVDASTGVVTGVAKGTANITATANDGSGVSATCAVKVSTLAAVFVNGAVIKVSFKWRGEDAGDYVQGTYNASYGSFEADKGGNSWSLDDPIYMVVKNGNNITIGVGYDEYYNEGMLWMFNAASDTYTYTTGGTVTEEPNNYGLISVTLNGTDITSQLTMQ